MLMALLFPVEIGFELTVLSPLLSLSMSPRLVVNVAVATAPELVLMLGVGVMSRMTRLQ